MKEILKASNIKKYYGSQGSITKAINGIDLTVYKKEYIAIMGASGSGKTTLLNMFSTLDKPTSGTLQVDGIDITSLKKNDMSDFRRTKLGFIFQEFNLLDTLTIEENIAFSLAINKVSHEKIIDSVNEMAALLGISDILKKYPYEVSGGQKQRAAAARAIINNPSLVLADEPTGALDSQSAKVLLETITKINREIGATILMVTHDALAASYTNSVVFIKDGKIFNRIEKGDMDRSKFFDMILKVVSVLEGGTQSDI